MCARPHPSLANNGYALLQMWVTWLKHMASVMYVTHDWMQQHVYMDHWLMCLEMQPFVVLLTSSKDLYLHLVPEIYIPPHTGIGCESIIYGHKLIDLWLILYMQMAQKSFPSSLYSLFWLHLVICSALYYGIYVNICEADSMDFINSHIHVNHSPVEAFNLPTYLFSAHRLCNAN